MSKIVEKLVENFGDRVKVRSQYHIQVFSENQDRPNDIWFNQYNILKFKLYGNREVVEDVSLDYIITRIKKSATKKSELDLMREMLNVAKFIENCERTVNETGSAIFTDAGFKDGNARIAAVYIELNGNVIAKSQMIQSSNIQQAEEFAIELGQSLHETAIIYNDNQQAVAKFHDERTDESARVTDARVKWLPRDKTKIADHFANIRKK